MLIECHVFRFSPKLSIPSCSGDPHCPPFYSSTCSPLPSPLFTTPLQSIASIPIPVTTVMTIASDPADPPSRASFTSDAENVTKSVSLEKENVPVSEKPVRYL